MTAASAISRCGYIAIVGRPNVGKSTLLNRILGTKLSITSRRPQTTRYAITGIRNVDGAQCIYVDTPGLQNRQAGKMHRTMNRTVLSMIDDVDVVIFVVDGLIWGEGDERVLNALSETRTPVILVINKIDRIEDKTKLLPHIDRLSKQKDFAAIIPLSAFNDKDMQPLEQEVIKRLPLAPALFPEDVYTDRSERFLVAEIIREKIMRQLGDEIPYEIAVAVESFSEKPHLTEIHAVILVEKEGQKKIIIGSAGSRIKLIGEQAREDIEVLLQKKVLLKLWVKIKAGWSEDDRALKSLGFE